MTPIEKMLGMITSNLSFEVWFLAKLGVLVFLGLYFLFTLVVIRQIKVMSKTVTGVLEKELSLAAYLLSGLAMAAFITGLVIL